MKDIGIYEIQQDEKTFVYTVTETLGGRTKSFVLLVDLMKWMEADIKSI